MGMKDKKKDKEIIIKSVVNTNYHIGMRVIKTALAVLICLLISKFVDNSESFVTVSSISAIIALQQSSDKTLRTSLFRIIGSFIGGILGVACVQLGTVIPYYTEWLFIIIIPLMIVAAFYLCNVFKLTDAAVMACVVILIVAAPMNLPVTEAVDYSIVRVLETLAGVSVSIVLNIIIAPRKKKPKYIKMDS